MTWKRGYKSNMHKDIDKQRLISGGSYRVDEDDAFEGLGSPLIFVAVILFLTVVIDQVLRHVP